MKIALIALSLLVSVTTLAKDMSRTEKYEDAYRDLADGSREYVGGCSLHQDYEDKMFKVTKELVATIEPAYDEAEGLAEIKAAYKNIEAELVMAFDGSTTLEEAYARMAGTDDITLEKVQSLKFKDLDLYRYNAGVGGGNGYYIYFNRSVENGKISYEQMAYIFDGDMEQCDSKVWLKK